MESSRESVARARLEQAAGLLPVAAPVAVLAAFLAVAAPALVVQDTWLTLVSGREIASHGLPFVDHLTVLGAGRRWIDQQWLAQLTLYGAAKVGIGAAVAVHLAAVAVAFALAAHTARMRGASPRSIAAFFVLAVAAAPWALQVRAQGIALPLFAATVWLLARDRRAAGREVFYVVPLLVVWANVHGSVVLGAAVVCLYGLLGAAQTEGHLRWRAAVLAVLAPSAVLASPYALHLPGYYRLMLLDPPFGREIVEWHRTTPSALTASFFVLAAITCALVTTRRARVGAPDLLVLGVTIVSALLAVRGIVWFALAALALVPPLATRAAAPVFRGAPAVAAAVIAVAVAAGSIAYAALRPAGDYSQALPPSAVVALRHTAGDGVVYADDRVADRSLWALPDLRGRVFYDVRFELYTRPEIDQLAAYERFAPAWASAVSRFDTVVTDPEHARRLSESGWRPVWLDEQVAILSRSRPSA